MMYQPSRSLPTRPILKGERTQYGGMCYGKAELSKLALYLFELEAIAAQPPPQCPAGGFPFQ
jgi:hypothetical protein